MTGTQSSSSSSLPCQRYWRPKMSDSGRYQVAGLKEPDVMAPLLATNRMAASSSCSRGAAERRARWVVPGKVRAAGAVGGSGQGLSQRPHVGESRVGVDQPGHAEGHAVAGHVGLHRVVLATAGRLQAKRRAGGTND